MKNIFLQIKEKTKFRAVARKSATVSNKLPTGFVYSYFVVKANITICLNYRCENQET